jgi:hypothetical protein
MRPRAPCLLPILLLLAAILSSGCSSPSAAPAGPPTNITRAQLAFPVASSVGGVNASADGDVKVEGTDGVRLAQDPATGALQAGLGPLVAVPGGIIACGASCNASAATAGMVVADGSLISYHDLALHARGPDGDATIYFYDQGRENGQWLQWSKGSERFQVSNDTEVLGEALVHGPVGTVSAAQVPDGSYVFTPALEGNEMAVYLRGSATLVEGRATVAFPAAFAAVVGAGGITAQVTLTSPAPALWVSEKAQDHVTVETVTPFAGNATFDYFVQAPRAGGEGFHTVR